MATMDITESGFQTPASKKKKASREKEKAISSDLD